MVRLPKLDRCKVAAVHAAVPHRMKPCIDEHEGKPQPAILAHVAIERWVKKATRGAGGGPIVILHRDGFAKEAMAIRQKGKLYVCTQGANVRLRCANGLAFFCH